MFTHLHSFKDFDRFFIGFDPFIQKMTKFAEDSVKLATSYPPYNLKKIGENKYQVEIAVAGFSKSDLEIELDGDSLIVRGNSDSENSEENVLYKGIAGRAFTRTFKLADQIEVKNASLVNGILRIVLDTIIPEHNKIKIDITEGDTNE